MSEETDLDENRADFKSLGKLLASNNENINDDATSSSSLATQSSDDPQVWPLQLRTHIVNDYIIGDSIGTGSYARVHECIQMVSLLRCAVKIVDKSYLQKQAPRAWRNQLQELRLLRRIQHEHVVKMYDFFYVDTKLYIFLEFCTFELSSLLAELPQNRLCPNLTKVLYKQLLLALEYLHSCGIVHRDIKPQNMLVNNCGQLKLIDLGVSYLLSQWNLEDNCSDYEGSPLFQAPEVIVNCKSYSGFAIDVWSAGITLYHILYGIFPFFDETLLSLYDRILADPLKFEPVLEVTPKWQQRLIADLLMRMLDKDPKRRLTIDGCKNHPWLQLLDEDANDLKTALDTHSELLSSCHLEDPLQVASLMTNNNNDDDTNQQAKSSFESQQTKGSNYAESSFTERGKDLYRSTSCLPYLHNYHFPDFKPTKAPASQQSSLSATPSPGSPHEILDDMPVEWGTERQFKLLKLPNIRANRVKLAQISRKSRARSLISIQPKTTRNNSDSHECDDSNVDKRSTSV